MWTCPKCESTVDDEFEVCWSCGTTREGEEDPTFVHADEAEPIVVPPVNLSLEPLRGVEEELPAPPLELIACYETPDLMEAKFLVDQLANEGIPAVLQDLYFNEIGLGFNTITGRVMVRAEDHPRARAWVDGYERRRAKRSGSD